MIKTKKSFELRTSVFYAEPEERMREPSRSELWAFLGVMGVVLLGGFFEFYGIWHAGSVLFQKVMELL